MKANSAAAAVLLLADQANGGYYFPSFFGFNRHRSLASEQCLEETSDFFDDSLLSATFDAVEVEIEDKAVCPGSELGTSNCEVDFGTFNTLAGFTKTCEDMGGKTVRVNVEIECGLAVAELFKTRDGLDVNGFSFKYNNLVDCVSMECDDARVKDKIDASISKAASTLESSLDASCTYSMEGFVSPVVSDISETVAPETPKVEMDVGDALGAVNGAGETNGAGDVTPDEVPEGDGSGEVPDDETPGDGSMVVKDPKEGSSSASAQCRILMTAALGVPLLNMALAA